MGGWSNETMRERGSGTGNMGEGGLPRGGAPGSGGAHRLDAPTVALVRVAAALAEGKLAVLRERFVAARGAAVPDRWIEELLLQSLLVVGYPLALVAFGVWREVRGPVSEAGGGDGGGGGGGEELAHEDWRAWSERGSAVCAAVYGRAYHKLLLNLRSLHPALEDLVLVDAYGKVIGRPGLDLKRRELCTVATIAVLGAAQQLHSHLRGALNTGATRAEVEQVLAVIDGDLDAERRRSVHEQWADVKERNL
jgi:4-carboxymuconolactone decarboxylase